jgi:hypothetical protein
MMKLSEAILLGSTMRAQCFGSHFGDGGSCGWGAALEAVGRRDVPEISGLGWEWAMVENLHAPCGCFSSLHSAAGIIHHLCDFHRWTRQKTAEWVRQVEPGDSVVETADALEVVAACN